MARLLDRIAEWCVPPGALAAIGRDVAGLEALDLGVPTALLVTARSVLGERQARRAAALHARESLRFGDPYGRDYTAPAHEHEVPALSPLPERWTDERRRRR